MQDCAMFWNPADLVRLFNASPALIDLYATVVIPPELLDGSRSFNPEIYEFCVRDDKFLFYPDGHKAGAYVQDLSQLWWLKTNRIISGSVNLVLTKLDSYKAHHVFHVTRRSVMPPTHHAFDVGPRVSIPTPILGALDFRFTHIDAKIYDTIISYAMSVSSLKAYQIKARARAVTTAAKDRTIPFSDEMIATQIGASLQGMIGEVLYPQLRVTKAHHILTRQGPIGWLRRLFLTPARAAWEAFLKSLDVQPFGYEQTLSAVVVGDSAELGTALTGEYEAVTFKDLKAIVDAVIDGQDTTSGQPWLGGTVGGSPYISKYFARRIMHVLYYHALFTLPWHVPLGYLLVAVEMTCRAYPRSSYVLAPALAFACYAAPRLLRRLSRKIEAEIGRFLHLSDLHKMFPGPVQRAYYNLKLARAPRHLDVKPAHLPATVELVPKEEEPHFAEALKILPGVNPLAPASSSSRSESTVQRRVPTAKERERNFRLANREVLWTFLEPAAQVDISGVPDCPDNNCGIRAIAQACQLPEEKVHDMAKRILGDKYVATFTQGGAHSDDLGRLAGALGRTLHIYSELQPEVLITDPSFPPAIVHHVPGHWFFRANSVPFVRTEALADEAAPLTPSPPEPSALPIVTDADSDAPAAGAPLPAPVEAESRTLTACPVPHGHQHRPLRPDPKCCYVSSDYTPRPYRDTCRACRNTDTLPGRYSSFGLPEPPSMPPHNTCLLNAISKVSGIGKQKVWDALAFNNPRAGPISDNSYGMDEKDAHIIAVRLQLRLTLLGEDGKVINCGVSDGMEVVVNYRPGHYYCAPGNENMLGGAPDSSTIGEGPRAAAERLAPRWFTFEPDFAAADRLLKNIEAGHFGILMKRNPELLRRLKSLVTRPNADRMKHIKISLVCGLPGSGKSYPIIEALRKFANSTEDRFRFVTPSLDLRTDAAGKFKLRPGLGYRVSTYELPFTGSYAQLMVLDEVGKYPPGYTTLLALACPRITHILATGDPAQDVYNSPGPGNTLNTMTPEIDRLARYASTYLKNSTRFTEEFLHVTGIPGTPNGDTGDFIFDGLSQDNRPVVTSTEAAASTLTMMSRRAFTCSGSQGITFSHNYEVHFDKYFALASDRAVYTAITRGKRAVGIIRLGIPEGTHCASPIARAILASDRPALRKAIENHIARYTPARLLDPTKMLGGSEKYAHDASAYVDQLPHLSGIVDETPVVTFPDAVCPPVTAPVPTLPSPFFKTVLDPLHDLYSQVKRLFGTLFQETRLAEERERLIGDILTEQVCDKDQLNGLFIRHKRGDRATEDWTMTGRYVRADGSAPVLRYDPRLGAKGEDKAHSAMGLALFEAYCRSYEMPAREFNQALWEECAAEDQCRFFDKGVKRLAQIADRASPDWVAEFAEVFMKGQAVTKPGTIDKDSKMGQLIISFNTEVNFRFGALAKYMARYVKDNSPPTVYSLDGNTDVDTTNFVQAHWSFDRLSSEDDYTAFDSTQGNEFKVFDALLMRHAGIPGHIIDDYLLYLGSVRTFLGLMGPMMASGFKFTLTFNTERSKAYQALKYFIPPKTPIMATGDDVALNAVLPESPWWLAFGHRFRLVSKRVESRYPTFCGWILNPHAVFKLPNLLLHRTVYQMARGNINACMLNYAADITPLQNNLELIAEYLTEEELNDHYATATLLRGALREAGYPAHASFTTGYASARNYDLTSVMLGGSINTAEPLANMPYNVVQNPGLIMQLNNADFFPAQALREFTRQLMATDFSVITQRTRAHEALNEFLEQAVAGEDLFGTQIRFPDDQTFFCDHYPDLGESLEGLAASLSYRESAVAKDTKAARDNVSRAPESDQTQFVTKDQERQDATRQFGANRRELMKLKSRVAAQWNRQLFERRSGAVWTEPPAGNP
jgi:hypothetical protein